MGEGDRSSEARLLRATFYILTKQQDLAMADLTVLIENPEVGVKLRVNALIKRASLYIQQCKDPTKDPQLSFADFALAVELDPDNADNANLLVHRGLVALQAKGDVARAVELIQSALELDEKCEFAYETLGTIEVQRGNLKRAIELFDKAIPLANTELEMGHLFGLRDAAMAQITVSAKLGITLPAMGMQ